MKDKKEKREGGVLWRIQNIAVFKPSAFGHKYIFAILIFTYKNNILPATKFATGQSALEHTSLLLTLLKERVFQGSV